MDRYEDSTSNAPTTNPDSFELHVEQGIEQARAIAKHLHATNAVIEERMNSRHETIQKLQAANENDMRDFRNNTHLAAGILRVTDPEEGPGPVEEPITYDSSTEDIAKSQPRYFNPSFNNPNSNPTNGTVHNKGW